MKTKNNILILQRMLIKSDLILNDILNLTMQISTQSFLQSNKDERSMVCSNNIRPNKKEINEFRNILMEQFKETASNHPLIK